MKQWRVVFVAILLVALGLNSGLVFSEQVPVLSKSGTSSVPVRLNDVITVNFVIDTGASVVVVPHEVFILLRKAGTIRDEDFLPDETFTLANGSKVKQKCFMLQKIQIGSALLTNVQATAGGSSASLLLGQSALKLLPGWQLDLQRDLLTFNTPSSVKSPTQNTAVTAPQLLKAWRDYLLAVDEYELAKREAWLSGKLPPRLIVVQEKLGELSRNTASWPTDGDPLQCFLQKIVDRHVSMVNLSIRGFEGESASERLEALHILSREELAKLFKVCLDSKLDQDDVLKIMVEIMRHPLLFFTPGKKYIGAMFQESQGKLYTTFVFEGFPAAKAGLYPGTVITNIDGRSPSSAPDAVKILRSGIHKLELENTKGQKQVVSVESQRFIPFGGKSALLVNLVNLGNKSISRGIEGKFRQRLARGISKADRGGELVFCSFQTADLNKEDKAAAFQEIASSFDGDYSVGLEVDEWKIASEHRAFVGKVRICTCSARVIVYSNLTGGTVFDDNISESLDASSDKEQTFALCLDRLVERVLKSILPLLKS